MPKISTKKGHAQVWVDLDDLFKGLLPHLRAVLIDESDFVELRLKAKPDGTTLAILKKYDMSGGPVVCFGSGYGVFGSMLAINGTIAAGNWKVDKPWQPREK